MTVRIGLVLPDVMGTYGDSGNAVVLRQRLRLRGIDAEIVEITLADPVPDSLDIYTLGGAEDYAQRLATKHLIRYPGLQRAAVRGAPVLAICAAIQVLGHWYETSAGERVDGVGLLDVTTAPQAARTIGEVSATPLLSGLTQPLTGFENHRGGTVLGRDAEPLSAVTKGRATAPVTVMTARCRAVWWPPICTDRAWHAIRNWPTTCSARWWVSFLRCPLPRWISCAPSDWRRRAGSNPRPAPATGRARRRVRLVRH